MLDRNGYPEAASLAALKDYDLLRAPLKAFLGLLSETWWCEELLFKLEGELLVLHTGGWSGNEETVKALGQNFLFWGGCWRASVRGGHHFFDRSDVRRWEIEREQQSSYLPGAPAPRAAGLGTPRIVWGLP